MSNHTQKEQDGLQEMAQGLVQLRDYLVSLDLESDSDLSTWFDRLARIKEIQGNSNNDASFVACLLAKQYLASRFAIGDFDVAVKPQGAPGLDIELKTTDGKYIIGEIKTTVPYSGVKNDLGAQQKAAFRKDFAKLEKTQADHKFLFVTDQGTFDVIRRKYAAEIRDVAVVLLPVGR